MPVSIAEMTGYMVLDTKSDGPNMLTFLSNSHHTITANYKGKTEQRTVNISTSQHARQVFSWPCRYCGGTGERTLAERTQQFNVYRNQVQRNYANFAVNSVR